MSPVWNPVPFWAVARRVERTGQSDATLLSVYREWGVVRKSDRDDNFNKPSEDLSTYKVVREGDLVFNKMKAWQGSLGVSTFHGIVSPAYFVCELSDGVHGKFVHHLLRSRWAIAQFRAGSKGIRPNQWDLPYDVLRQILLPMPGFDEQRRIADFLDERVARIDRIVAARQAQRAAARHLHAALLQSEFDAASDRGAVRLGYLLRGLEQGWSPQADATPAEAGQWGVMRAGSVNGGFFRAVDNKALPEGLEPRAEYEIHGGDILMSRASGSPELIGSVAVVPQDVRPKLLLPDKLYRLTLFPGWSADFVVGMLRAHENRERIRLGISGAEGMANNLPSRVIRGLRVPQLSLRGQGEVVERLAARQQADRNFEAGTTRSIELLTEYKHSLITAAVTGEFDVTTASTKIPGEHA